ncbi:MAG: ATP synthase F1 subunit delta [Thermostichales cyanobacterium BF4_bins_65]
MALMEQVGIPYAEALVALGQEHDLLDAFAEDVKLILGCWQGIPELRQFLCSPIVAAATKKKVLQDVFLGRVQPLVLNFLQLLAERRRLVLLETIGRQFLERQRQLRGIALAEVTSAVPLSAEQQQQLRERLKTVVGAAEVELDLHQDPRLLGGLVVKVGSQVIDLSLRGQLRRLALQLV